MEKKTYIRPEIRVKEIATECDLLQSSTLMDMKGDYDDDVTIKSKPNSFIFEDDESSDDIFGDE